MAFKMTCPKCESYDYSVERDRRIRTLADPAAGLIFSCRCGKQLFGASVVEEHKRQLKVFEATRSTRSIRSDDAVVATNQGNAPVSDAVEAKDTGQRGWMDNGSRGGSDSGIGDGHAGEGERCSWHMCGKVARAGSKYCSRACSNKNARWRYKKRKNAEREAA